MSLDDIQKGIGHFTPLRPLTQLSLPDGTPTGTEDDRFVHAGLYPLQFVPPAQAVDFYLNNNVMPRRRIIIEALDGTNSVDISEWVSEFGSVSRQIDYLIGKMSPSSHSFRIKNVKLGANFLFTLRKNLGLEYWMNKEYNIHICFYEDDCQPNWLNIYTGKIQIKKEDRIGGSVRVSSNDIIQELNAFKTCKIIASPRIFNYELTTDFDDMGIQRVLKYGTHKMITNGNNKELTNRNNPFSVTVGVPNFASASIIGFLNYLDAYHLFNFPTINAVSRSQSFWQTGGGLKMYYWDYIDRIWRQFAISEFDDNDIQIALGGGLRGFYAKMSDPANIDCQGDTWTQYLAGSGAHFNVPGQVDPAVCVETTDLLTDSNPVRILLDILTNSKFIGFDTANLDYFDFTQVDDYTWDKAFSFFDNEGAIINISYGKEVSLMTIINQICLITGMSFFGGRKLSESEDRRIKIIENSPLNPKIYPLLEDQLVFSTADKIKKFEVTTDQNKTRNKVISIGFDSSYSTPENFDIFVNEDIAAGDIEREQQLGSMSRPPVYWYNSGPTADAIGQRYLFQYKKPVELISADFGKAGFELEVGELVDLHDQESDETITGQIYKTNLNLKNFDKSFLIKRFPFQFGPDPETPCQLWAFASDDPVIASIATDSLCPAAIDNTYWAY